MGELEMSCSGDLAQSPDLQWPHLAYGEIGGEAAPPFAWELSRLPLLE